jgi:hypothetical protein
VLLSQFRTDHSRAFAFCGQRFYEVNQRRWRWRTVEFRQGVGFYCTDDLGREHFLGASLGNVYTSWAQYLTSGRFRAQKPIEAKF